MFVFVPFGNFSLIWRISHYLWRNYKFRPILAITWHSWPLSSEVLEQVLPIVIWDLSFSGHPRRLVIFRLWHLALYYLLGLLLYVLLNYVYLFKNHFSWNWPPQHISVQWHFVTNLIYELVSVLIISSIKTLIYQ